jgi:hypothetical protein
VRTSSSDSGCNDSTNERDSRGATTENDGFSVVAATSSTSGLRPPQQRVLLRLREPVHLVDEQHRLLVEPVAAAPGVVDHRAQLADSRRQRRERDEVPVPDARQQPRQRGLTGAGRPVQQHRRRRSALDEAAQRRAGPQQVRLPDHLVQRPRPHPHGQRRGGRRHRGRGRVRFLQVEQAVTTLLAGTHRRPACHRAGRRG